MDSERPSAPPSDGSERPRRSSAPDLATAASRRVAAIYRAIASTGPDLELQLLGRILLRAMAVGVVAGLFGSLFVLTQEMVQTLVLTDLAGYTPICAAGEICGEATGPFRWWLLLVLPAIGGLAAGLIAARWAPETMGGGANTVIHSFHHEDGGVRKRVLFIKPIVSVLTLGFGGSGGREGPTMLIGGAVGSTIARVLRVSARERRILLVAGAAAGVSAVFRTPLGAALLAVEVMHRDDFESDALVPAVLASVVSYSVFIFFFGEADLFAHARSYPFRVEHLPLYAVLAVLASGVGAVFVRTQESVEARFLALRAPLWLKPAIGGLLVGALAVPTVLLFDYARNLRGQGLGILGGGYGAAQAAITEHGALPSGWAAVLLLLGIAAVKTVATALTSGSGGSAGNFGPALAVGALVGAAFGRAAQIVVDPEIDPGAFALVGMGTLYGGIAHVPIAALVLVCEMAGSYDLLVPLMLSGGIAFVVCRRFSLYPAQKNTKRDSPAHSEDMVVDVLRAVKVGDVLVRDRPYVSFHERDPAREVLAHVADNEWQDVFPVLSKNEKLVGIITSDILRTVAADPDLAQLALAADMAQAPQSVREDCDLHSALEQMLGASVRELVVTDARGRIVGFVDEHDIGSVYHEATRGALQRATIPGHILAPGTLARAAERLREDAAAAAARDEASAGPIADELSRDAEPPAPPSSEGEDDDAASVPPPPRLPD